MTTNPIQQAQPVLSEGTPVAMIHVDKLRNHQDLDALSLVHFYIAVGILSAADRPPKERWYTCLQPNSWKAADYAKRRFGNYVVDRKTGEAVYEQMPLYARIGLHLLFVGSLKSKMHERGTLDKLFAEQTVRQGVYFDSPASTRQIEPFIKAYNIALEELYQPNVTKYRTFNEFFYRRLKDSARPIASPADPSVVVSVADCRLAVFTNVTLATKLWIKGKNFSLANLFQDEQMAKEFEGGSIGIFRLAPQDYHRFHAHQAGKFVVFKKITGKYYTVNPLAVKERIDVFTENVRTVHVLETPLADRVVRSVFVAIGALLVGSIVHTGIKEAGSTVKKGQELGWFAYGGSTCICVWPSGTIEFDKDLVDASLKGMETHVYVGESIGRLI